MKFTNIDVVGKRYHFSTKTKIVGDEEGLLLTSFQAASEHTAKRIFEKIGKVNVFEVCCGIGGTTVFLAKYLAHIYALDINPLRIKAAKMNARTFGVYQKITFVTGDALDEKIIKKMAEKDIGAIVTDVEWRELLTQSLSQTTSDINKTIPSTPVLFNKLTKIITKDIVMHLPANTDKNRLLSLGECEIEEMEYKGKIKFLNVYFGKLINHKGITKFKMSS